jgi:PAS domain-containing protein
MRSPEPDPKSGALPTARGATSKLRRFGSVLWSRRGVAATVAAVLLVALVCAVQRPRRAAEPPSLTEETARPKAEAEAAPAAQTYAFRKQKERETVLSDAHREQLEGLKRDLANPAKRLKAVVALFEAAGYHRIWVSSMGYLDEEPENAVLRERAAEITGEYAHDPVIIRQLLDSDEEPLCRLGLELWVSNAGEATRAAQRGFDEAPPNPLPPAEEVWHAMTPRLRVLAERSGGYWNLAITALCFYPENKEFLRGLMKRDKSASKVFDLVKATLPRLRMDEESPRDSLFNEQLLRLLRDPDAKVRRDALVFVYWNQNSAEIYWVDFSPAVAQRIEELKSSRDPDERKWATDASGALTKLRTALAEVRERAWTQKVKAGWIPYRSDTGGEVQLPPTYNQRVHSAAEERAPEPTVPEFSLTLPASLGPLPPLRPLPMREGGPMPALSGANSRAAGGT